MSSPICNNQDSFNTAFRSAVKYVDKKEKPNKSAQIIMFIILFVLILWALLLSMKSGSGQVQVKQVLLAIVFSPIYIIAYYLDKGNQ